MRMPIIQTVVVKMLIDFYHLGDLAKTELWAVVAFLWFAWIMDVMFSDWIEL